MRSAAPSRRSPRRRISAPCSPSRRSAPASSWRRASASSAALAPRSSARRNFSSHAAILLRPSSRRRLRRWISSSRAWFRSSTVLNCCFRFCFARSCSRCALATWKRRSSSRALASSPSTCGLAAAISSLAAASSARARSMSASRPAPRCSASRCCRDSSSALSWASVSRSNLRSRSSSDLARPSAVRFRSSSFCCRPASSSVARTRTAAASFRSSRSFAEASLCRDSSSSMRSCADRHSRSARTYSSVRFRASRRSHSRSSRCSPSSDASFAWISPMRPWVRSRRSAVSSMMRTDSTRRSS
mmetsp:Transcript_26255/g.83107  ORF Transcript_26255/g.83107 Transcript_26255/m.83107 type:complete len:302 (+) Transcript_26255:93-998(+)